MTRDRFVDGGGDGVLRFVLPTTPGARHEQPPICRSPLPGGVLGERCAAALSAFFQGKRALGKK
jgi:hypothetical protein